MISVIIPLYNKEKSIANTLRTVLKQTFQQFEIVVVNDGSTDGSVAEALKVQDDRIRIINQDNAGVSAARNRGIAEARYDLIAFLDADDEWKPEYLETQYGLYKKYPECSVYACNYAFCDHTGKVTPTILRKLPFDGEDGILTNYFEVASCSHPPIWTSAVMMKKEVVKSIGGFPVGITSGEDLLTWARLAAKFRIAFNVGIYAIYNIRPENTKTIKELRETAPKDLTRLNDDVGSQLILLYKNECDYLKKRMMANYVAFWYKMRAVINLNLNYRLASIRCSLRSIFYNGLNIKVYELIIIALFLPHNVIKKILR